MKSNSDKSKQSGRRDRLEDIDAVARAVHLWLRVFCEDAASETRSQAFAGGLITGLCKHLELDNEVRGFVAYAYALLDDHGKHALAVSQMMLRPAMAAREAADFKDGEQQVVNMMSLLPGLDGQASRAMRYVGVTQCNAGWFFVELRGGDGFEVGILEHFAELGPRLASAAVAVVDTPIDLPRKSTLQVTADLAESSPNGASVFELPGRSVIRMPTSDAAGTVNGRVLKQGLSTHPWASTARNRELEEFLRTDALHEKIRKMDPEVAFWALNGERALIHDKNTGAGFAERLAMLKQHCPLTMAIVIEARRQYSPKDQLANDAILDALVGAITATY